MEQSASCLQAHVYLSSTNSFDLRGRTYPLISAFCLLILKHRYNPEKVSTSAYVNEDSVLSIEFRSAHNRSVLSVYNSSRLGWGGGGVLYSLCPPCLQRLRCAPAAVLVFGFTEQGPFCQRPCRSDWELPCRAMLGNPGLFSVKLLSPKLWMETAMRAAWLL